MLDFKNKKVLVTGGSSMIGKSVVANLETKGAIVKRPIHSILNLDDPKIIDIWLDNFMPDYIVHCAGWNGNIQFNARYPADIFYRTSMMGMNLIKSASQRSFVSKIVVPLASCSYPDSGDELLKEENFWNGLPNPTVDGHGLSKRMIQAYAMQINKQFGLSVVCCIFNTCYGPNDSFDIDKTKVVGGLINKFVTAKINNEPEVICWGSGNVRREFIYCDSAAAGIVETLSKYDNPNLPINIGFKEDCTVKELAITIKYLTGYNGNIIWDTSKPDGQIRKLLDNTRMKEYGITIPRVTLDEGISKTIKWFKENYKDVNTKNEN